ncbi:MAG: DNA methylase [Eubacterium sp.]|nr:DNA methylase [Eubacterium sp.]
MRKMYIAIDLKSFYASVECAERGLNPLTTNLVVADASRTEKTICLAVSPSLKSYGISGRARLFEVVQKVKQVNVLRRRQAPGGTLTGGSFDQNELKEHKELAVDYLVAPPRMALYMEYSTRIYGIYLRYVAPEDMHVYSVDEVFIHVDPYLHGKEQTAEQFAREIMQVIYDETGITATAGIGTNLYLAKVAMDVEAKHSEPDEKGARMASLDEISYRKKLWAHEPITDFWRVGPGYAKKLKQHGIYTMGDVARCSLGKETEYYNEELLYRLFGVNAELLIDHAWGYEPCTIEDIRNYKPENNSISSGQVLSCPYDTKKARLIVQEMTDLLVLELVEKRLVTDQIVLTIGYDVDNVKKAGYQGTVVTDRYGRKIPKHAHGSVNLGGHTSSTRDIMEKTLALYDSIIDSSLWVRRVTIVANHVIRESEKKETNYQQMQLFMEPEEDEEKREKERKMQEALIQVKNKYGKNAILKGMNLQEGGTTIERNSQIGGHKA